MSYASSPKNFPNLLKSIPQKLGQPTGIAVLASVGIHVVLGASVPYWSVSSQDKPQPARNVQLLELSQNDLSRLPPPPLPSQTLPPNINQQIQPLSPSLPSPSSLDFSLPSSLSSSLPSIPSSLPSSLSSSLPSTSSSSLPSQKSPVGNEPSIGITSRAPFSIAMPPDGQSRRQNLDLFNRSIVDSPLRPDLGLQQTQSPPPPLPGSGDAQNVKRSNPQPQIATGPNRQIPIFNNSPSVENFIPFSPETLNSNQQPNRLPTPQIPPIATNLPAPPPSLNDASTLGVISAPTPTTQAAAPRQENLADDSIENNNRLFLQNIEDWKKRNQIENDPIQLTMIRGRYPEKARAAGVKVGSVMVNWKVDQNGNIIPRSMAVIGSSESGVFDQEALSAVRSIPVKPTGKEEAYAVRVIFMDDNPGVGNSTTAPTSTDRQSTPKPEVSPNRPSTPKPEATIDRPSTPKPESSLDRPSAPKPAVIIESPSTPQPEASPEGTNNPKPSVIIESPNNSKPEASPERPNTSQSEATHDRPIPTIEASPERSNPPQPQVSPARPSNPQPEAASDRPSAPKPEATTTPVSAPKPAASPVRPSNPQPEAASDRPSPPKPEATTTPVSAPKPAASPTRPSNPQPEATTAPVSAPKPAASPTRPSNPQPEATTTPVSAPKPAASPTRPSNPQPEAASDRLSTPKPEGSLNPPSAPKPEGRLKPPSVPTP